METTRKLEALRAALADMGSAALAFSGGVDSTFLAAVARDVLGESLLCVTAASPTYPQRELEDARRLARELKVRHKVVVSNELEIEGFADNTPDRCYHCKSELFSLLRGIADESGLEHVMDGTNADDASDYRPGRRAAAECGVRSPLQESGLGKDEIRALSATMGLATAGKAAFACLASRFPYGSEITEAKLGQVEAVESLLHEQGFRTYRARHHGTVLRLELGPEEMERIMDPAIRAACVRAAKQQGFQYVALDLEGYQTGSMNRVLDAETRKKAS